MGKYLRIKAKKIGAILYDPGKKKRHRETPRLDMRDENLSSDIL